MCCVTGFVSSQPRKPADHVKIQLSSFSISASVCAAEGELRFETNALTAAGEHMLTAEFSETRPELRESGGGSRRGATVRSTSARILLQRLLCKEGEGYGMLSLQHNPVTDVLKIRMLLSKLHA